MPPSPLLCTCDSEKLIYDRKGGSSDGGTVVPGPEHCGLSLFLRWYIGMEIFPPIISNSLRTVTFIAFLLLFSPRTAADVVVSIVIYYYMYILGERNRNRLFSMELCFEYESVYDHRSWR